ncbi:hypothetical protein NDU88_003581 [Pleurodeles waltl]|uniref:Uncharacterized protein n=1 Tax=Pleurodeles waltl TaxID=8319 RepID=A0AAV7RDI0_PLEWA|nr:hypothetical protein NDU88_003581 [Pleurodeles waltl]
MRLQDFLYNVTYVPDKDNVSADFLSRVSFRGKDGTESEWDNYHIAWIHDEDIPFIDKKSWVEEYSKDVIVQEVLSLHTELCKVSICLLLLGVAVATLEMMLPSL